MKKLHRLFAILAVGALAWSCSSESTTTDAITLSSEETQIISASGGKLYFNFTTNGSWKAHVPNISGYDWSSILPTSGDAGDNTITVTVLPNTNNEARTMTFTIYSGSVSYEVAVMQLSADGFAVVTKSFTVPAEGADIDVQVVSNIGYTYSVSDSWITVADTKSLETSSVSFTVAENEEFEERVGTIEFTAGDITETVTVTQEAQEPYFNIVTEGVGQWGDPIVTLPQEGGSLSFEVETNLDFVAATDGNKDWLTVTQDGNTITLTAASANSEYSPLEDWVYISCSHNGESYDAYGATVCVHQEENVLLEYNLTSAAALTDYSINRGGNSLAYGNGYLLVLDKTAGKIHALNGSDLSYEAAADVSALGAASIASDDAGHVLIANECIMGETFTVYCASSISDTPTQLISFVNNIYSGDCPMGNIRVRGDVTGDAVVTAYSPVYQYAVVWEITGGVVGDAKEVEVTPKANDNCWNCYNGVVAPIGPSLSDGLYMGSYSAPYNLEYYNGSEWSDALTDIMGGNGWGYDLSSLHTAEYSGVRYMAFISGSFFNYFESYLTLYMVADASAPMQVSQKPVSEWPGVTFTDGSYADFASYSPTDVVMVPGDESLAIFVLDASFNTIARIDYK